MKICNSEQEHRKLVTFLHNCKQGGGGFNIFVHQTFTCSSHRALILPNLNIWTFLPWEAYGECMNWKLKYKVRLLPVCSILKSCFNLLSRWVQRFNPHTVVTRSILFSKYARNDFYNVIPSSKFFSLAPGRLQLSTDASTSLLQPYLFLTAFLGFFSWRFIVRKYILHKKGSLFPHMPGQRHLQRLIFCTVTIYGASF